MDNEHVSSNQQQLIANYVYEHDLHSRTQSAPAINGYHSPVVTSTANASCQQRPNSPALNSNEINSVDIDESSNVTYRPRLHQRVKSSPVSRPKQSDRTSSRLSDRNSRSSSPRTELSVSITKIAFLNAANSSSLPDTQGYMFQGLRKTKSAIGARKYYKNVNPQHNKRR